MPTLNVDGCSVSIFLHNFANRGQTNCIKRQFNIEFASTVEAASFQFSHDKFFCEYKKKKKNEKKEKEDDKVLKKEAKKKQVKKHQEKESHPEPPSKKRRISCVLTSTSNEQQGNSLEQDDTKEKESYINEFKQGDELDFLDENFAETQDPFHDFDDDEWDTSILEWQNTIVRCTSFILFNNNKAIKY